ncbi:MAG TPA: SRPBCC domain-containing protein [Ignavibacteria bacterium]|nr:SRPBCC domain-containing protein [Ignavibacteria bacterium]HMQ99604.1 SRPBCC domain-containing protein [Ignavibacteria bacterium]
MSEKFKYNWKEFTLQAAFKGSPEKLFKMWTEPKLLCKWFLTGAKVDLKARGDYSFMWVMDVMERGKVLAVRKNSFFSFTFAGGKCDVKFRKSGKDCIVSLRQYGIPTDERHKVGTHMSCQIGWTFFLANLKSVLETGKDLREFNPKYLKEGTVFY